MSLPSLLVLIFLSPTLTCNKFFKTYMLKLGFPLLMVHMKSSYEKFTKARTDELLTHIPKPSFMSTLGVIYPNFWASNPNDVKDDFHQCLIIIKVTYCNFHKVRKDGM